MVSALGAVTTSMPSSRPGCNDRLRQEAVPGGYPLSAMTTFTYSDGLWAVRFGER
jgi:hypothetical protein